MGPRLGSRGKMEEMAGDKWQADMLQWSRDLEVAENKRALRRINRVVELQWGRDLEVAESCNLSESRLEIPERLQWSRDLEVAERLRW